MMRARVVRHAIAVVFLFANLSTRAGDLDVMGVTLLRAIDPTLIGTGIFIAQPEGSVAATTNDPPTWEVNPAAVGQPTSLFTWMSAAGTNTAFPNSLSPESWHANGVGVNFYSPGSGVAPGVLHVDNLDADFFITNLIFGAVPFSGRIVNQSFIDYYTNQALLDSNYDNYIAQYGTLICSGIGNGGDFPAPAPPSTCYNGLGVGAYGGASSTGPTLDNGRSKPDLVAPAGATSFSTPYVAGAGAVLLQAAQRGDGGSNTAALASGVRVLKALLLNGAVKPSNWTHTATAPLDRQYGAGIVNLFNAHQQLTGGSHAPIETTLIATGSPHPPGGNAGNVTSLSGWAFRSLTNAQGQDALDHYYFSLPANPARLFTLTATLVWNRPFGQTNINNLDLFLYDTSTSTLIASSVSSVDNVEHLYLPSLAPGRYDLQVLKNGGSKGWLTASEDYALAFETFALSLNVRLTNQAAVVSWPIYPAGFTLETTTNIAIPSSWTAVTNAFTITNTLNQAALSTINGAGFYRLRR